MKNQKKVAIIVGSLRRGSYSRKIAKALKDLAPPQLKCDFVEIRDLEMYDQDLDHHPPKSWQNFRTQIKDADAILFVTPEYNRSLPGCLKNALDVGSRPSGKNSFDGKPAGIVSVTPYSSGAAGANYALRQSLIYLNVPTMQQPEAYISEAQSILSPSGEVKSLKSRKIFAAYMKAFSLWVNTVAGAAKEDFDSFLEKREAISNQYIRGNGKPLHEILSRDQATTFFGPNGLHSRGANAVQKNFDQGASSFGAKSTGKFDIFQKGSCGQLAFWTGYQRAKMQLKGKKDLVTMNLRITEIFRFEESGWKMIHRHADMAK